MRDLWIWSVSLGRWWGVHVRVHVFFLLFALFAVYISSQTFLHVTWIGASCVAITFVSVLVHEIAHAVMAHRLGGTHQEIMIGPLGGLHSPRIPFEPQSELLAHAAGPAINLAIAMVAASYLLLHDISMAEMSTCINPLGDLKVNPGFVGITLAKLTLTFNWALVVVNLLPVFPFDAGRGLRVVMTFLWPELDGHQGTATICLMGKVASIMLLMVAGLSQIPVGHQIFSLPAWFICSLLAIYVYFNSKQEELARADHPSNEDHEFGYDFSQGYTSLERMTDESATATKHPTPLNVFQRWYHKRLALRAARLLEQEAADDRRMDEVLQLLHEHGMQNLSREDRELLQRVSARYRNRQVSE